MRIKQAIDPVLYNEIMQRATDEMRKDPSKGEWETADDVCRPYLKNFERDMASYEDLVFHITKNLQFMFRGVGFHDYE
jgi:hypothetical protein